MKKLLILSDSHGNLQNIDQLRSLIAENDYVIHLGDGAGDMRCITREYPEKVYLCAGNCDFSSPYPIEGTIEVENVKIFYCHGHTYGVKSGLANLALEAKKRGCDIALYGHTHIPQIMEINGVTLVNPGSLRYKLHKGGSYCYLVVHKDQFTPVIVGNTLQ